MSFLRKMKRSMSYRPKIRPEKFTAQQWYGDGANDATNTHKDKEPDTPIFSAENVEFYNLLENPENLTHCEDLSDNNILPLFVKEWVDYERLRPSLQFECQKVPQPFAYYKPDDPETDIRVVLTMASRFGDVGISPSIYIHDEGYGYKYRVLLTELKNFHKSAIEFEYGKPGTPYNMQDSIASKDTEG